MKHNYMDFQCICTNDLAVQETVQFSSPDIFILDDSIFLQLATKLDFQEHYVIFIVI